MATDTERAPDASMTLITSMLRRPLDPGYAAAAQAREAAGLPRAGRTATPLMVAATLAVGLLVGVGASALRAQDTTQVKARSALVAQITDRRAAVDAATARAADLQAQVNRLESAALGDSDVALQARLASESLAAGAVAVTGPGFVVTLDDAPSADQGSSGVDPRADTGTPTNTVLARDIQIVVNSLWESGAEAVSVNGLRLTALSAIRFAGEAILVDFRPLTRPYVVTAIGDPRTLPQAFTQGSGGAYLSTLSSTYGIQVDTGTKKSVTLSPAPSLLIRYAQPVDTGSSPSPSRSSGGSP